MLTTIRSGVILAALLSASIAHAQTISLGGPSLSPDRKSITIRIGGTARPDPSSFVDTNRWVVVARSPGTPAGQQLQIATVAATSLYATTGLIRITFASPAAADVNEVDVVSLIAKPVRVTWSAKKPQGKLGFFAVDKREKADVYIFGSWVTGNDLAPVYNIDISVGSPINDFSLGGAETAEWRASAIATVKSAEHRNVDPDSYLISAKVGRIYPVDLDNGGPYVDFQWEVARLEFSRKDESSNFVTAPTVTYSRSVVKSLTNQRLVRAAVDAEFSGGLEIGHNMQSKVVPGGYGTIVRLVPGVAAYASFPGALGLDEVRWTTTYKARILATKEAFTDVRDDDHPFPSVARGTRHEWKDVLDFKVNPLFSLTLSHEFGSVPPAFKILNHRYTLGATVMWAWKK